MPDISSSSLLPLLEKLQRQGKLDQPAQAAILGLPHKLREHRAHDYLSREGDEPRHVCLLLRGFAIGLKIAGNGARQILALHMRSDLVDLENALRGRADHGVQAITPVVAAYIPIEAIEAAIAAFPAIGCAAWRETMAQSAIAREWMMNVGRRDARTRTAHFLCELGVRLEAEGLGRRHHYDLPMTQDHLADMLGLTPIHINRTLRALGDDGLIQRCRRSVSIGRWNRLAMAGDFNGFYLHLEGTEPTRHLSTAA